MRWLAPSAGNFPVNGFVGRCAPSRKTSACAGTARTLISTIAAPSGAFVVAPIPTGAADGVGWGVGCVCAASVVVCACVFSTGFFDCNNTKATTAAASTMAAAMIMLPRFDAGAASTGPVAFRPCEGGATDGDVGGPGIRAFEPVALFGFDPEPFKL